MRPTLRSPPFHAPAPPGNLRIVDLGPEMRLLIDCCSYEAQKGIYGSVGNQNPGHQQMQLANCFPMRPPAALLRETMAQAPPGFAQAPPSLPQPPPGLEPNLEAYPASSQGSPAYPQYPVDMDSQQRMEIIYATDNGSSLGQEMVAALNRLAALQKLAEGEEVWIQEIRDFFVIKSEWLHEEQVRQDQNHDESLPLPRSSRTKARVLHRRLFPHPPGVFSHDAPAPPGAFSHNPQAQQGIASHVSLEPAMAQPFTPPEDVGQLLPGDEPILLAKSAAASLSSCQSSFLPPEGGCVACTFGTRLPDNRYCQRCFGKELLFNFGSVSQQVVSQQVGSQQFGSSPPANKCRKTIVPKGTSNFGFHASHPDAGGTNFPTEAKHSLVKRKGGAGARGTDSGSDSARGWRSREPGNQLGVWLEPPEVTGLPEEARAPPAPAPKEATQIGYAWGKQPVIPIGARAPPPAPSSRLRAELESEAKKASFLLAAARRQERPEGERVIQEPEDPPPTFVQEGFAFWAAQRGPHPPSKPPPPLQFPTRLGLAVTT